MPGGARNGERLARLRIRVRFQAPPVNDADADDAGLRGWFAALSALRVGRRTPPGGGGAGAPPCLPV